MKFRNLTFHSLLAVLAATPALAITDTWDGGGADNNLATGLNWVDDSAPASNLTTTDLIFAGLVRTTPNVSVALSTNSITFNNTAGTFTLGGLGLTVGSGGIVNNDADTQTFSNSVSLGTAASTFNTASGGLIFNGALGLGTSTLNVTGTANTTLGVVNGTGTINKSGFGTLMFQPGTAHVFDLVQSAGTVQTLAGGPTEFNTGSAVQINGGTFAALGALTLDGAAFTRGAGVFTLAGGATLSVQNAGSFAFSGPQVFDAGQTISVTGGSQVTSTSFIDLANGGVGGVALTVDGAGSLLQSGSINDWGTAGNYANVLFTNSASGTLNGGLRLAASGAGGALMNVNLGAQVTTSSLAIGTSTAGAQASVYVDGASSKLKVTGAGATTIGAATGAAQTLAFYNGGTFESGTGALTIGATGTMWADGDFLANGDIIVNGVLNRTFFPLTLSSGKNLTVQAGGDANLASLTVPASSTATFTGAGTTFTGGGSIITTAATSLLNVSAGAVLSNTALQPANGSMIFDGAGTQLNSNPGGYTAIGGTYNEASGTATVTFRNNAAGTLTNFTDVGAFNSTGASGTLQVQSGADLTLKHLYIAGSLNQTGVVSVDGSGSTMTQTGDVGLGIGRFADGSATLQLTNGATFTTGTAPIGSTRAAVEATGTLSLVGTGTTFTANTPMAVRGQLSTGVGTNFTSNKVLRVEGGGDVTFAKSPVFGSSSEVYVTGAGSTLTTVGAIDMIFQSVRLFVTDGGVVQSFDQLHIGTNSEVTVDGVGSQIRASVASLSIWGGSTALNSTTIAFRNGATAIFGNVEFDQAFSPVHSKVVVESGADLTLARIVPSFTGIGTSEVQVTGVGTTFTATTGGIVLGEATSRASTLTISDGSLVSLAATGTNRLVLNPTGTVNLSGGTLALGEPISRLGGVLNFTAGALVLAEDLTVGAAGLVGANLTLTAAKQLTTPGLTQVEPFNTLTLDGGTLTTGTLANSGTIDFKKGTLAITGAGGLNVGTGALGSIVTLGTGANLSVSNTMTIANGAQLRINGGSFSGNAIVNNGTIDHRDGALSFTGQMTNTAGSRLFVGGLSFASGTIANAGTITMQNGIGYLGGAGAITNTGIITGDGMIAKPLTNSAGGQLRAEAGKTLFFTGAIAANAGTFSLEGGTLEFTTAITNSASGVINGSGKLRSALLTNNGNIGLSGDSNFYGDVTNAVGSRIIISGGSTTTFFDDVIHNGTEIRTSSNSASLFFGAVSGPGPYTGSGIVYFEGDLRPGSSPAAVPFAPQVILASSNALTMEIGGLIAGTQHDKLTFTHAGTPQVEWGGALTVTLINGFVPTVGQSFDIFDFDAARDVGAFSSITLPALTAGLAWDTSQLYTTGTLTVIPAGLSFSQWATASGIPGALPTGDHDSDGTLNAVEFALGLFPEQLGTVEPVIELHNYGDGDRLRARFTRPLDRSGVTLIVQGSDDLVTWQDLATSVNSAAFTGSGFVSENRAHPLGEPGLAEVFDLYTTSNKPRRWMRISVTLAP